MDKFCIKSIRDTFFKTPYHIPECIGSLASVMKYFGGNVSISALLKNSGSEEGGVSLDGILNAARAEGFSAEGYEGDINFLKEFILEIEPPYIAHMGGEREQLALVEKTKNGKVTFTVNQDRKIVQSLEEFSEKLSGGV